jgi:hypothetical protein
MNQVRLPIIIGALTAAFAAGCQLAEAGGGSAGDPAPTTASTASALTADDPCAWAATVAVTPSTIPATLAGVPVKLDVAVTNATGASCAPLDFEIDVQDTGLVFDPRPVPAVLVVTPNSPPRTRPPVLTLAGGATGHLTVTATAPASADAGDVFPIDIVVAAPRTAPPPPPAPLPPPPPQVAAPTIPFTVAAAPGCQVSTSHELMIRSVSVVDDPVRTVFAPASRDPRSGAWSFKHLVEGIARTPAAAPAMVEAMLTSFTAPAIINGFTVAARPGVQSQVLATWPRTADGALDLARAPLHLQAIVSRLDLRNLAAGDAGEGRFVFAFDLPAPTTPGAAPPQATIIFEYKLPASRPEDVVAWANAFHLLGSLPFGEPYNAVLQLITERFVHRGARPGHPNASAISAVRTNEIPFGDNGLWELREFHLARSGDLQSSTVELTPDGSFNNTAALAGYITANQAQILADKHTVPALLDGQPFAGGAIFNRLDTWFAPGIDNEARHHFAINTCNGCHGAAETGTVFLHLVPRAPGAEADRSRWLTGTVVDDPATGAPRSFDDLGRRKADLAAIVCRRPGISVDLAQGIRRVH